MKMQKMSDADIKFLKKKARQINDGYILEHLILAYQTIFDNACDENAETLEFKPEILEAMKYFKEQTK